MAPEITQLAQVGGTTVAVYLFYKVISNHLDHNTKVLGELAVAIRDLKEFLQNHRKT